MFVGTARDAREGREPRFGPRNRDPVRLLRGMERVCGAVRIEDDGGIAVRGCRRADRRPGHFAVVEPPPLTVGAGRGEPWFYWVVTYKIFLFRVISQKVGGRMPYVRLATFIELSADLFT